MNPTNQELKLLLDSYNLTKKKAESEARVFVRRYPLHFFGWQILGAILYRTGRYAESLLATQNSIKFNHKNHETHNILGNIYIHIQQPENAEKSFREAIHLTPTFDVAYTNLGNLLRTCNRLQEAKECFLEAIRLKPNSPVVYFNLGNIQVDLGEYRDAIASFRQAISIQPDYSSAHTNLGNAQRYLGLLSDAQMSVEEAIRLDPKIPESHNSLGNILRDLKQYVKAENSYREAIKIAPDRAELYSNLGAVLIDLGYYSEAASSCREAIRINPKLSDSYSNLGDALRELGEFNEAIECYSYALTLNPNTAESKNSIGVCYWKQAQHYLAEDSYKDALRLNPNLDEAAFNLGWLYHERGDKLSAFKIGLSLLRSREADTAKRLVAQCMTKLKPNEFSDELASISIKAFEETWLRPIRLAFFAQDLLLAEPSFKKFVERTKTHIDCNDLDWFLEFLRRELNFNRLLEVLLTNSPLSNSILEQFFSRLRCLILEILSRKQTALNLEANLLHLLSIIAQQCYINEYIFSCSDEEARIVARIQEKVSERLKQSGTVSEGLILIVACYESLSKVLNHEYLLVSQCSESIKAVLDQQVREPQAEQGLRTTIPRLSEIQDAVSLEVQSQYEQNPYPRWVRIPKTWKTKSINKRIRDLFPNVDFTPFLDDIHPSVLVAGCGTGQQPIEVACLLKNSEVLAVDLSMASLAYAKRKALESCTNNVSFAQADILKLSELNRKFDVIESSGVLHHMRDPFAAWDVLLSLLNPKGLMKIGLYSDIARRKVTKIRDLIQASGINPNRAEIVAFRQTRLENLDSEDFGWAVRSPDFFSTSGCRDLLFHVQEHRMTLPVIEKYLNQRSLKFLGFEIDHSVIMAYQHRFPDDKAATVLSNWDVFENENPDIFQGMYQFWIQKV